MNSIFTHWQTWALMSAAFAALTAILAKIGIDRIDPTFATFLRTLVIALIITATTFALGAVQPLSSISSKSYLFLGLSGAATALSWLCYFHALKLGPAALVATIDKLSVVFVALLSVLVLGERLSSLNWLGVGFVTGGALLLMTKS